MISHPQQFEKKLACLAGWSHLQKPLANPHGMLTTIWSTASRDEVPNRPIHNTRNRQGKLLEVHTWWDARFIVIKPASSIRDLLRSPKMEVTSNPWKGHLKPSEESRQTSEGLRFRFAKPQGTCHSTSHWALGSTSSMATEKSSTSSSVKWTNEASKSSET